MANYKKMVRDDLKAMDSKCPALLRHGRNLNLAYMDGKLEPCFHREDLIRSIQRLLLRKNKANILLTGPAGCGKTAIAEALAAAISDSRVRYLKACDAALDAYLKAKQAWEAGQLPQVPKQQMPEKPPLCDCVVYELSLNSAVSGTKYRGEFEERLEEILREIRGNPRVILFVDEIHHICRVGAAEGCVSAGQILKPALARNEIRLIGATTTQEKADILQDPALARRFTQLEVPQLQAEAAQDTAKGILKHYSHYHKVTTKVPADWILAQVQFHLPDTVFPDNFINVVDETLAGAVLDGNKVVNMADFNDTLSRMTGRLILSMDQRAG